MKETKLIQKQQNNNSHAIVILHERNQPGTEIIIQQFGCIKNAA